MFGSFEDFFDLKLKMYKTMINLKPKKLAKDFLKSIIYTMRTSHADLAAIYLLIKSSMNTIKQCYISISVQKLRNIEESLHN